MHRYRMTHENVDAVYSKMVVEKKGGYWWIKEGGGGHTRPLGSLPLSIVSFTVNS